MTDTNNDYTQLQVFGRAIPDYSKEIDSSGNPYQLELPGTYEISVLIDGVYRPIAGFKRGGLLADIERAKQTQAAQASSAAASSAEPSEPTQAAAPPPPTV